MYVHELANACVEFEQQVRVPMSLVNEAIFEASFVGRDELIEAFRSKVALDTERKAVSFKTVINKIAPVKQCRSIFATPLKRHQQRNVIILPCWTKEPKWSLNIKRMLLDRSAGLSFRNRISLCSTGPFEGAIKLELKPPSTGHPNNHIQYARDTVCMHDSHPTCSRYWFLWQSTTAPRPYH